MAAIVNEEDCTACGICVDVCSQEAITLNDVAEIDQEKCTECGDCVDECPSEAISIPES
ncbi:MAG: 4Fe-4S binding protein [Spirochaetota bacterium]